MSQKDIDKLIEGKSFNDKSVSGISDGYSMELQCRFDETTLEYYVKLRYKHSNGSATEYYDEQQEAVDRFNELRAIHSME